MLISDWSSTCALPIYALPLPIRKVFFRHGAVLPLCGNGALCLWQAQDELVGVPHIEAQYAASEQPVDAIHTGEIDQRGRGLFLPLRQRQCLARLETEVPAAIADPGRARQHRFHGRRSEEHTPELQTLMSISFAVFSLKK